jgi:hypothetical protein
MHRRAVIHALVLTIIIDYRIIVSSTVLFLKAAMSTAGYLDHFLEPVTDALTPEFAIALANLRADPQTQTRIDELRRKAANGTLSELEGEDYKNFVEAVDMLSILQSKARQFLKKHSG